jgi:formyltetrahydrofolate-dependent phosphoribosylglycinamide formyltransferase
VSAGGTGRARVAVLASGGGSNLQALLDHGDRLGARRAYDVALVAANRADAGALARAAARGIPSAVIADPGDGPTLDALLASHGADLVVLAGYLKLVPADVTRRYHGRMLNVHPALLPAFGGPGMYGRRVHAAVLAAGARVSGPTVHLVDEAYDRGAIVAQWPVPVHPDDTPEALAARVLAAEHLLLPRVVQALAAGRVAVGPDGRARVTPARPAELFVLSGEQDARIAAMDQLLGEAPAPSRASRTPHPASP